MKRTHRDEIFGKDSGDGCLWCLHCERAYKNGEYREEVVEVPDELGRSVKETFQMCPYEGCDGDTVLDDWDWAKVRECHPEYPEVPERNKVYPLS